MHFNSKFKNVELHSHLDGSCQAETLIQIAQRRGHSIKYNNSTDLRMFLEMKEGTDLIHFLQKFDTVLPIVAGDKEAIAAICDDYIKICAYAHICYVESRFSPEILQGVGCDAESVLVTVLDALERSGEKYGVNVRVILSAMRHMKQGNPTVIELALKYRNHGVVGIDVAGDEKHSFESGGTSDEIVQMFEKAYKHGIHRTVHAGENGPAEMIHEAVYKMHAERIGHGYNVLHDKKLYHEMKNMGIHFEICPSSSFLTGSVPLNKDLHPIHQFHADKFNYSISCDDLMITGRNLVEEHDFCHEHLKIPLNEIRRCNINAAKASFLNETDRESLLAHLSAKD